MLNNAEEMRKAVRTAIDDDDCDDDIEQRFTDPQLDIFIQNALRRLESRVGLNIDMVSDEFVPIPNDVEFNLIFLQTTCMITKREYYNASRKGIKVKQDDDAVDTTGGLSSLNNATGGDSSFCAELEQAVEDYLENPDVIIPSVAAEHGTAVWSGNSKKYEDVDHDGQHHERIYFPNVDGENSTRNDSLDDRCLDG